MNEKQKARLEFARRSKYVPVKIIRGNNTDIHRTASIGFSGFGFVRDEVGELVTIHHAGGVKIGMDVCIRAFVTIDRATAEGKFTEIMDGVKIDHKVHISHNCKIGKHTTIAANSSIEGSCVIGEYCTIGSNVTVQRKVKVGNWVVIGSGSVVTKDVPDNSVVVGNPARLLKMNV